jgi:hypothetical protein
MSLYQLARTGADTGWIEQARGELERIHGWFTEGRDTIDLKEANNLLA